MVGITRSKVICQDHTHTHRCGDVIQYQSWVFGKRPILHMGGSAMFPVQDIDFRGFSKSTGKYCYVSCILFGMQHIQYSKMKFASCNHSSFFTIGWPQIVWCYLAMSKTAVCSFLSIIALLQVAFPLTAKLYTCFRGMYPSLNQRNQPVQWKMTRNCTGNIQETIILERSIFHWNMKLSE